MKRQIKPIRSTAALALLVFLAAAGLCGFASAATFTEGQIREVVRSHIEKNMQWNPADFRIAFLVPLVTQEFKGKKITCHVQDRHNEQYVGETVFTVKFYDQGTFVRELPVPVRMETAVNVLVSAKPLAREAVLAPEDVKIVKRWYVRVPGNILTDADEVAGKILMQTVRPNMEITKTMLKTPLMIKKGNLVKIVAESGALEITTVGLSEDNGGRGDIIRVKNIASNKVVYAKVVDQALVRVDF